MAADGTAITHMTAAAVANGAPAVITQLDVAGALLLGVLIGWFVYYINRYRTGAVQLSDLTTLVSVVGTASATLFFSKAGQSNDLFAGFSIGLFIGFFGYLLFLITLVAGSKNFTFDWFLDGRRRILPPGFYIPDQTAVTIRPALAPQMLGAAAPIQPMAPHARSFRPAPAARRVRDVDPSAPVSLTVVLKPKAPIVAAAYSLGRGLGPVDYRARHGTDQSVIDAVAGFAHEYGLTVEQADPATHTVKLSGTYGQARAAFHPEGLAVYAAADGGEFVSRSGHIWVPSQLADQIVAVMGFDQRPVARPHSRFRPMDAAAKTTSYTPAEVARRYEFPVGATGAGQTIALIELGGGYRPSDMAAYFTAQNVSRTGALQDVSVDGGGNSPGSEADGEVQLDIEVAGCVAPGADIRVYFAPNTANGFRDAVAQAINDGVAVISISWGSAETTWAAQDMDAMDQAFSSAAARNVTVCVASGDNGSVDQSPDGQDTADFPSSSPNALGCGGTSLPCGSQEVAWNDADGASGGGFSSHFLRPSYQPPGAKPGRGVPDVSGDADPETGYAIAVNGQKQVSGGTSAVAPLWAALIALANQQGSRNAGFINPSLYANRQAFNDITSGGNGGYQANAGWDPVTGLGSPIGSQVASVISGAGG